MMIPAAEDFPDSELIELFEDRPHFVHAPDCPNYCDYACNARGFEEAAELFCEMDKK